MAAHGIPNVWTQMDYVPPRGQCNFKQSIVSAKCPCLRFMLHPLKSASSYECDGCYHHASFHSMESPAEDEIRKRWAQEAQEKQDAEEQVGPRPKKRLREIEYGQQRNQSGSVAIPGRFLDSGILGPGEPVFGAGASKAKAKAKKKGAQPVVRTRGSIRSRGRVTEVLEDDDDYIELVCECRDGTTA
ncbi:hypothetical protein K504DRAFT_459474 [Pleomassaria siparia CBS 279.74]|uniref:Uncharacterized protein n=1 Tax=Pleomassaria siparia CBS 279.74 TaxID=1314801 RepID=A0A6G1K116_9PLEO|nr:hypothetical protein K504DRAFT_459474 [Pleomassaria siparia CBS 279.74]